MANHSKGGIVILYYIQNEIEMLESALVHLDEELEILPHGSLRCVDVVSMDVYLPEYQATDYADAYEKLVAATSRGKVAALAEVGYLPDVDLLQKSRIPWAYYMTWSKEFCIGEKYNSVENLKKMYDSEYAVTL